MRVYTKSQSAADAADFALFHELCKAERLSEDRSLPLKERIKWREAWRSIDSARRTVRSMMHPETRNETAA